MGHQSDAARSEVLAERRRLTNLVYGLVGSLTDADDAVR